MSTFLELLGRLLEVVFHDPRLGLRVDRMVHLSCRVYLRLWEYLDDVEPYGAALAGGVPSDGGVPSENGVA